MTNFGKKDLDMFFIPEEHVDVVLLAKQLYELPDGNMEIQNICKTLHPYYQRTIRTYDHFSKGLFDASKELTELTVGRFYTITGFLHITKTHEKIDEVIFGPEFRPLDVNKEWSELVMHTIRSIRENELFTHVSMFDFEEKKEYSKEEAFWWTTILNDMPEQPNKNLQDK